MNFLYMLKKRFGWKIISAVTVISVLTPVLLPRLFKSETAVKPERGPVIEAVYALGTVKTDKIYNARFGMNTIVRKLYVREGDTVNSGTPLVLGDTSYPLSAPFPGIVTAVNYLENEMAASGQVILTVSSVTNLYVKVSLDQESILSVKKGQTAELSFENLRNEKITGTVEAVYLSGDEFIVRIAADKFPQGILPQMTCDTAIIIRKNENALIIPSSAVKDGKIELVRNGKRMTVAASVNKIDLKKTEVLDDSIHPDDRIIVSKNMENNKD